MPSMAQVVLDALQCGADPVVALQEYVEEKDDFHVPRAWCARFIQNVLDEQRLAGKPAEPESTEDGHLESEYEDRVSGAEG